MADILGLVDFVNRGGEAGRQRGQQNRLAALASQAYGAAPDQQRGFVQQAIATDPQSGFALGRSLGDDRQQRMGSLSQKARMLVGYAKAGNRQGVDGLYPQLAQEAQALGLAPNIPTAWDDSYLPGIEQLAMMGGAGNGAPRVQSRFVGEDGQVYAMMADSPVPVPTGIKADRQMWFRDHPGMAPELVGKDGLSRPVGAPSAQPQAEGPTRATMEADVELANAMVAAGIPSEQIDAFLAARGQRASQMSAAQPQQGAQARPSEAQIAAQTEAAKLGVQMQFAPQQQAIETQGAIDRARGEAAAKLEAELQGVQAKRRISADDTLGLLSSAEQLLETATSGRAGATVDAAVGFFGESTEGSRATAALKTLAGQLTAKMPRMEGPQSDRDVQMYKDMAGDLANPNLPRADRLAALQMIRALNQKYASQNTGDAGPSNAVPTGGGARRLKFNPASGRLE